MADRRRKVPADEFPRGHEEHKRRQILRGLELSPIERLRWLQTAVAELRALLGRAGR